MYESIICSFSLDYGVLIDIECIISACDCELMNLRLAGCTIARCLGRSNVFVSSSTTIVQCLTW